MRLARATGTFITITCGIVVIVSVFLSWIDWGQTTYTAWNYIDASLSSNFYLLLVLVGGILMIIFNIPTFIFTLASKGSRKAIITLNVLTMIGALLAVGGSIWFITDVKINSLLDQMGIDVLSVISYGVWIAIAGAMIGFIFAILTSVLSKAREK